VKPACFLVQFNVDILQSSLVRCFWPHVFRGLLKGLWDFC